MLTLAKQDMLSLHDKNYEKRFFEKWILENLCNFFKFISIIDDENNRRKNSTFQIFRIVDKNVFLDENGIPPKSNTICNGSTIGFSANIGINYKWISQIIKNHDGFEIPTNFVGNEEFYNFLQNRPI